MNYPKVNLLKKNERRYQGAVSHRFLTISLVVTPILLIAVLSGVKLIQYTGVQSTLRGSRSLWADLEPKLKQYKKENKGLAANRQAIELFEGWDASRGSFVKLLTDVQGAVPENIQFTRLSVRAESGPSVYSEAEEMELNYALVIEGVAEGARAENHVIALRRDLLACEQIGSTFDSMKLASLRKRDKKGGGEAQVFRLVGATAEVEP